MIPTSVLVLRLAELSGYKVVKMNVVMVNMVRIEKKMYLLSGNKPDKGNFIFLDDKPAYVVSKLKDDTRIVMLLNRSLSDEVVNRERGYDIYINFSDRDKYHIKKIETREAILETLKGRIKLGL